MSLIQATLPGARPQNIEPALPAPQTNRLKRKFPEPSKDLIQELKVTMGGSYAENLQRSDYPDLVARVRLGDPSGDLDLYNLLRHLTFYRLLNELGPSDADDGLHDAFVAALTQIRAGTLARPQRLPGYLFTIARFGAYRVMRARKRFSVRDIAVMADCTPDPRENVERCFDDRSCLALLYSVLAELASKETEILERFYIHEQTAAQICRDMRLSSTQFRLLKCQAKRKFGELGRGRLLIS